MGDYMHGIYTDRKSAELSTPEKSVKNGVAVIGVAPINLAEKPSVNDIVTAYTRSEAVASLGYLEDFEHYTLLHSIYMQFNKFSAAPVVFINVLDPGNAKHVTAISGKEVALTAKMALIEETGILLDKLVLSDGAGKEYEIDVDYVASFDDDGYVVISAIDGGAMETLEKVTVTYVKLNPDGVTEEDIIGGVDKDGVRTGMELLDEIYPRTGIIPSIIIAPGYSKIPAVAATLEAKARLIYDLTNAMAFVDLDSSDTGADAKEKVKEIKAKNTVASRWNVSVWPMAKVDDKKVWGSAVLAALAQSAAIQNNDVPSESPSNMDAQIDGVCLEGGREIYLTQDQVNNYINAYGVVSFLKLPGWKIWGNNTAAYPASTAPQNRFIKSVLMLNWMENTFKTDYLSSIDRNANYKLIQDVVNEFNIFLNSLTPDYLAGGYIIFEDAENPIEQIAAGKLIFHTVYADYSPTECIRNTFEYDLNIYKEALEGGND